ncbi:MAG: hypothetical protein AAGG11_16930 [Pseudomonadota bacterium]
MNPTEQDLSSNGSTPLGTTSGKTCVIAHVAEVRGGLRFIITAQREGSRETLCIIVAHPFSVRRSARCTGTSATPAGFETDGSDWFRSA